MKHSTLVNKAESKCGTTMWVILMWMNTLQVSDEPLVVDNLWPLIRITNLAE